MGQFKKAITREEFDNVKEYLALTMSKDCIKTLGILVDIGCINRTPTMREAAANFKAIYPTQPIPKIIRNAI